MVQRHLTHINSVRMSVYFCTCAHSCVQVHEPPVSGSHRHACLWRAGLRSGLSATTDSSRKALYPKDTEVFTWNLLQKYRICIKPLHKKYLRCQVLWISSGFLELFFESKPASLFSTITERFQVPANMEPHRRHELMSWFRLGQSQFSPW